MMNRRTFLCGLTLGTLSAPLVGEAQQGEKVYRIGWLGDTFPGAATPMVETVRLGLRDAGYVEGHNLVIEFRGRDAKADQLRVHMAEFARLKVDAILAVGTDVAQAAVAATKTIPIVFLLVTDPIGAGLVGSFARPGGNVTGVTTLYDEAAGKYLELLREILPGLSRVGLVSEPGLPSETLLRKLDAAAKVARVTLQRGEVRRPEDFDATFSRLARQGVQAVIVWLGKLVFLNKAAIAAQALRHRLPTLTVVEAPAQAGLMIAYQPSYPEMFRRAGVLVGRILKGASPADLPVEEPSRFQLIINVKTAKALGLTIPPSVLQRADKLIQ